MAAQPSPLGMFMPLPLARKNLNGWPGHVNAVVRLAPLQLQVAAAKVVDDPPLRSPREHPGDADGAGPRPASERLAAAALPCPLPHFGRRKHLDEFDIDTGRKRRRMLDFRPQP